MTSSTAAVEIRERVAEVRKRIADAAGRAGRPASDVTLIAVSKTWPVEAVKEARDAAIADFGENRVHEGCAKAEALADPSVRWHLIGHLQTNKVRAALNCFDILHSVDSERLLRAVSAAADRPTPLMIEVNVAQEPSKFGIAPGELPALLELARSLPNVEIRGLMTVAPHVSDPEETRPVFRALRELAKQHELMELSMGMTNDFEVAIEEGATYVRVGRAIFGDRS